MLPFSVKYSIDTAIKNGENERARVLQYVQEYLAQKSTKDISINNDTVSFKSASWSNWNIMSVIEKGTFEVRDWNGYMVITYEFFMYQLCIIGTAMAIVFGLVSQSWLFGIVAFCMFFGANWLIALLRHQVMFYEITDGIKRLDQSNSNTTAS